MSHVLGPGCMTDNETLLVTISFQDSDDFPTFLRALTENNSCIEVEHVTEKGSQQLTSHLDSVHLTPKQQEALILAVDQGYYDTPRTCDLNALAEELEISTSGVSQRLHRAEAKLVKAIRTPLD